MELEVKRIYERAFRRLILSNLFIQYERKFNFIRTHQ
jgi:hypothetical protein